MCDQIYSWIIVIILKVIHFNLGLGMPWTEFPMKRLVLIDASAVHRTVLLYDYLFD